MKKTALIFLLFICYQIRAQNINGEVIYNVSYNLDKLNELKKIKRKKNNRIFEEIIRNTKDVKGHLIFSSNISLYNLDNSLITENNRYKKINLTRTKGGGKNKFFTNLINNEVLKQDCVLLGECFVISNSINKWELSQNTKIVGGKKCFLATTTEEFNGKKHPVSACYSPTIPYAYGPKNYSGLPGLILELNDGLVTFTAIKITLNKVKKHNVELPKGKKVNQKEFEKLCKKSFPKELFEN